MVTSEQIMDILLGNIFPDVNATHEGKGIVTIVHKTKEGPWFWIEMGVEPILAGDVISVQFTILKKEELTDTEAQTRIVHRTINHDNRLN